MPLELIKYLSKSTKKLTKKSILNNYPLQLPLCKGELEGVACRYGIRLFSQPLYDDCTDVLHPRDDGGNRCRNPK